MKKLLPFTLLLLIFASCKTKQRTCTCTYTDANGSHTFTNPVSGTSSETHHLCDNFTTYLKQTNASYLNGSCALK